MRTLLYASSIVAALVGSELSAQIRTPIATEPIMATSPGPAPYNAKAVALNPTSVAVSWDVAASTRGYTVDRSRADDPACCVAHSGLITTPSWTDGALEAGRDYVFVITALYSDGRQGSTQVVGTTPMPDLATRVPKGAELLSSAEGVLRFTPCGQKNSGGPGPTSISPQLGTPAGARLSWPVVISTSEMNYVVDRAPEGTTTWTLVGSTCGGPSAIRAVQGRVYIRDLAGGVTPNSRYVYRVTAVSNGAAGWNTYHFTAPCRALSVPTASVAGSTVTVSWTMGSSCNSEESLGPDSYTITSEFGYTKTILATGTNPSDVIYGVALGSHTFRVVGNYQTGGSTAPVSVNATVAY